MAYSYRVYDQQGQYFITCTVHQWVDFFTRKEYVDIFLENIKYCQEIKGLEVYGWVVMTNHVHLIISSLKGLKDKWSDIIRDFKKYTSGFLGAYAPIGNLFKGNLRIALNEIPGGTILALKTSFYNNWSQPSHDYKPLPQIGTTSFEVKDPVLTASPRIAIDPTDNANNAIKMRLR